MGLPKNIKVTLLLIGAITSYFLFTVRINGRHVSNEETNIGVSKSFNTTPNWQHLINGDGHGYYAYLPSIFITKKFGQVVTDNEPFVLINNHSVIKQPCGTAICQLPFFMVAYIYSTFNNKPEDGYSKQFQLMIGIAGIIYLLVGLFAIAKILIRFRINSKTIVAVLVLITFATNLFYYAVFEPSMCHVYAFALEAIFLLFSLKYFRNNKLISIVIAFISLAILLLIRPIDVVTILILPFIYFSEIVKNKHQYIGELNKRAVNYFNRIHFLIAVILFAIVISFQSILWFIQSGKFFVNTYIHEGFYFSHPAVFKTMFGFNHGFFIYSPVLILIFIGLINLYKFSRKIAVGFAITFLGIIYVTASWWCWNYSDGLGLRPLVDHYALFVIPIAFSLDTAKNTIGKILTVGFSFICLLLSCIQTYQYQTNIMHHFSMDWNKYKYIFFKTESTFRNSFGGNFDVKPFHSSPPKIIFNQKLDTVFSYDRNKIDADILSIHDVKIYGWMYVEMELKRMDFSLNSSANAFIKIVLTDTINLPVYIYQLKLNDYPDDYFVQRKRYFNYKIRFPKKLPVFNNMIVKISHKGEGVFTIHEVGIKVFDFEFADQL